MSYDARTGHYSKETLENVKNTADISNIIANELQEDVEKTGKGIRCSCPFCKSGEKNLFTSDKKQIFQCFDCGESGDVYSFLMKEKEFSLNQSIEYLAEKEKIELPPLKESTQAQKQRDKIFEINKEAASFFNSSLHTGKGTQGLNYLKETRGLTDKTINKFGLGVADNKRNSLYKDLKSKGFTNEEIQASGLVSFVKDNAYDKFRNRVMFPIINNKGKVVGFNGRILEEASESSNTAKYINTPETLAFFKKDELFGMNLAVNSPRLAKDGFILCEGNLDVISLHQAGFTNAVASLGTSFTTDQANLLRKYTDHVHLLFDNDDAGKKAALKAIPTLKSADLKIDLIDISPYKDPDEFLKSEEPMTLLDRFVSPKSSYEFEVDNWFGNIEKTQEEIQKNIDSFSGKMVDMSEEEQNRYMEAFNNFLERNPEIIIRRGDEGTYNQDDDFNNLHEMSIILKDDDTPYEDDTAFIDSEQKDDEVYDEEASENEDEARGCMVTSSSDLLNYYEFDAEL